MFSIDRRSIFLVPAFCFLTLALSSCATPSEPSLGAQDRATTKAERATRADDLFILFDADGDGYITRSEMERGLRSASNVEMNPNLVMAMDSKGQPKKKKPKVTRALSDAQVKRAVEQAFKSGSDKKMEDRISKDEFRKIVAERPSSETEDPWAPFM
ncbi:MAG: EF-hand domain-containing protein [Bdellovibrionota bacterium]